VKLTRDVAAGEILTNADVALDGKQDAVRIRREMEREAASRRTIAAE
jgi:predicted homoserine dehydrogenase-like protein